jgi:hypothetical protein
MKTEKMQKADRFPEWLETEATVTGCHYEFARMNTLTLGIATDANQFLIAFSYYAHGQTYTDEFTSPVLVEQGTKFTVLYNPLAPQQNSKSRSASMGRSPLIALGVAGSIVLAMVYVAMMRGCS